MIPETGKQEISGEFGSFTLIYRRPSFQEIAGDADAQTLRQCWSRRLGVITGWEGVVDEHGDPIKYEQPALDALAGRFPELADKLFDFIGSLFRFQATTAKNFNMPPSAGPEEPVSTATAS